MKIETFAEKKSVKRTLNKKIIIINCNLNKNNYSIINKIDNRNKYLLNKKVKKIVNNN